MSLRRMVVTGAGSKFDGEDEVGSNFNLATIGVVPTMTMPEILQGRKAGPARTVVLVL